MKVTSNLAQRFDVFPKLKNGEVFVFMRDEKPYKIYMKVNEVIGNGGIKLNAVNLETGELTFFVEADSPCDPVYIKPNATVVLYI